MKHYNNILITGGCGFIGSNFINYIFKKYEHINIVNIDKINYCAKETNINNDIVNSNRYILYKVCIKNKNIILDILNRHAIDVIIHFAAQTHVSRSFINTNDFMQDNIIASYNLLEAVKDYSKIKCFLNFSTDEVYGESLFGDMTPKREENMLNPTNPYAASKAAVEMIMKSYFYSFKIPIKTIRCNNVYGINQYSEKVVPKFINQLINNKKITIEGIGNNKRAFIHTDDVNDAVILILEKGEIGDIYNIGINNELTIIELARILIKHIKKDSNYDKYIEYIPDRLYNDKRYFIDYTKLSLLGWKPKKIFEKEILNIIDNIIENKLIN